MKLFYYLLSIIVLTSCQSDNTENSNNTDKVELKAPDFPRYNSVLDMLIASSDYTEEAKTLKVLSNDPLHIQVAKETVDGDTKELINEIVKRNIVYVSLQAFAQTDIKSIKITSLPLKLKSDFTFDSYLDNYQITATITKEKADKVLKKYLNTTDYKKLFQLFENQIFVPSNDFEKLKHSDLNDVFNDLTN